MAVDANCRAGPKKKSPGGAENGGSVSDKKKSAERLRDEEHVQYSKEKMNHTAKYSTRKDKQS